jgi:RNAse (barnase) inhibitor barstar
VEDRAKSIFQTACTYSNSAQHLNRIASSGEDMSQFIPSQVIAALALELYFKSLYFIKNKEDFRINGKYSHNFHALVERLSPDIKNTLEIEFQSLMTLRNMNDVSIFKSEFGIDISLDLAENLQSWSDVFTKVRYVYDKPNENKSMMFFTEIEQAVKKTIFSLRPDLGS